MDNQYFAHYLAAFKPYANFEGRVTRPQYWYFVLFNIIISLVLGLIDGAVFGQGQSVLGGIYGLVTIIPSLAIAARRLHDIGKSGRRQLLSIISTTLLFGALLMWTSEDINMWRAPIIVRGAIIAGIVGLVWFVILLATDTVAGKNQYDIEATTPVETPITPAA